MRKLVIFGVVALIAAAVVVAVIVLSSQRGDSSSRQRLLEWCHTSGRANCAAWVDDVTANHADALAECAPLQIAFEECMSLRGLKP